MCVVMFVLCNQLVVDASLWVAQQQHVVTDK